MTTESEVNVNLEAVADAIERASHAYGMDYTDGNDPQFVVAVTLGNEALSDLGLEQSIEALCDTINDLMPADIKVRPLSEIIAC